MYLSTEITNDSFPFPSPSNAPDTVTETDDAINPMLIRRSASFPNCIVSGLLVNNPMSVCGTAIQSIVPITMTPAINTSADRKISLTRFDSPAP